MISRYCGFHIYVERIDSITVYYEKFKDWIMNDSIIGMLIFAYKTAKQHGETIESFISKFNERFIDAVSFTRFVSRVLFLAISKINKLLNTAKILQSPELSRNNKNNAAKSSIKKVIPLSKVDKITIEDVIHSDVQLAINSRPVHVKYFNYQTDSEKFFGYVEADLKALKEIKH